MARQKNLHSEVADGLRPLFPRLWRFCLVLTGHPGQADDLAQSACVRALEKSGLFMAGTLLDRWVFKIAQNLWLNELRADAVRRGGGMSAIEDIELADPGPGPESNFFARQVLLEVLTLPEAQRATVVLVYVEGYSYREAAELLDIPVGTVMSRLAAARAKLAGRLEQKESTAG